MGRKKRPRPPSVPGLVKFEEPHSSAWAGSRDAGLFQAAAKMRVAEQELDAAMDELALAEQRLSELPKAKRTIGRVGRPAWFVTAEQKEQAAGHALEDLYQQISRLRAHTKPGLAIKLRLLAELYGEAVGGPSDDSDMVSVLLSSLLEDVSEQ